MVDQYHTTTCLHAENGLARLSNLHGKEKADSQNRNTGSQPGSMCIRGSCFVSVLWRRRLFLVNRSLPSPALGDIIHTNSVPEQAQLPIIISIVSKFDDRIHAHDHRLLKVSPDQDLHTTQAIGYLGKQRVTNQPALTLA